MITGDEIEKANSAKPFSPFFLELSTGERIKIDNPALCLVFPLHVMVLRRSEHSGRLEDYELIGIDHVAKLVQKAEHVEEGVNS